VLVAGSNPGPVQTPSAQLFRHCFVNWRFAEHLHDIVEGEARGTLAATRRAQCPQKIFSPFHTFGHLYLSGMGQKCWRSFGSGEKSRAECSPQIAHTLCVAKHASSTGRIQ
jgi:hypothetical protein